MIRLSEFMYLIRSWKHNRGRAAGRCVSCGVMDWWVKNVSKSSRVCFSCYMDNDREYVMITANVPSNAQPTYYDAGNGHKGTYWIWQGDRDWYWAALGNEGIEDTRELACSSAKFWIRYGQSVHPTSGRRA